MLNDAQRKKVLEIWDYYIKNRLKFINASEEYTQEELDKEREKVIIVAKKLITDYTSSKLPFEEFKTEIDILNKRNRLWGFKGMNGQMYFNMLTNSSTGAGLLDNLKSLLKEIIMIPADISEGKRKIGALVKFSDSLAAHVSDKRQAPKTRSCTFFITYFWQIQDHTKWPIYYKSMIDALSDSELWSPSGDSPKDYEEFYLLNYEMKAIITEKTKNECTLWDIEHALWIHGITKLVEEGEELIKEVNKLKDKVEKSLDLPSSFIPPVVSILPQLAKNDPNLAKVCEIKGYSIDKIFEERIASLFRMLGYRVEDLGQGKGRVPDGIAICSEYQYAIIYDAKVRTDGYKVGTDDRAIKEYINNEIVKLKKAGIRNAYFVIISSFFKDDFKNVVRSLKIETEIKEVLFLEASALLSILDQKLRSPEIDLGPYGIQGVFVQSGIVTDAEVKEILGI